MARLEHVAVGGLRAAVASRAELVRFMVDDVRRRRAAPQAAPPLLVFDSNGHAISLAAQDPEYRSAMAQADLVHADGGFVVLASKWLAGAAIPERSATTDMIHDFAAAAEREGLSFFLLGGTEAVNAACAERLALLYPRLRIAGRRHGFFSAAEEEEVVAEIGRANPDLLWVGLGKPKEQLFAARNRARLRAGWVITCGGCFNYVTGDYRRAPKWMQAAHLEWLFRAITDPKLIPRYATTSPHAIWLALARIDRGRYPARHGDH